MATSSNNHSGLLMPLAVVTVSALVIWGFSGGDSSGFAISPGDIDEVVKRIRDTKREQWLAQTHDLIGMTRRIDQVRDKRFAEIREGAQGESYLEHFIQLAREKHAPVEAGLFERIDDPDVPLSVVFEAAKAAELHLTNSYRDIRGALTAIRLEVPAIDAIRWIKVVRPRRITLVAGDIDSDSIRGQDALEAFKHEVNRGASEIDAMLQHAEKIVEKAEAVDRHGGGGDHVPLISEAGFDSTRGPTLRPDETTSAHRGTADGGFDARPGRVVADDGRRQDWMYVDKWYVMGPFENRFRSNLDASFLPETVVDLDNVTLGKDDREIGWRYWDCKAQRIEPSWAPRGSIYYGWTEVYMEQAGKYWVALGSDDYGKVWINGKEVWKSDTVPKPYRADEYVGEFEFRQGANEVLFRCENNGGTMGWSMVICTMASQ
ncbi:MAG: hypothetical protein ACOCZK_06380 [Planctomycetota bacterium]